MATATLKLKKPINELQFDIDEESLEVYGYVKRRIGRWLVITDEIFADRYKCSECMTEPPCDYDVIKRFSYCPCCGAYLKGGIER